MFSMLKRRIMGLRSQLLVASRTADEMLKLHDDEVWERFTELEASDWKRSAYREFLFWKMTREYARGLKEHKK